MQSRPPGWEGRQTTHGPVVGIWQRSHRGELPSVSPGTCEEVADGPWAWMGSVLEGSVLASTPDPNPKCHPLPLPCFVSPGRTQPVSCLI